MTDDRGQKTEGRGQRTDDRRRMTEDGGQRAVSAKFFLQARGTVEGLLKKMNIEHRTSNIEC
jgi:hypothetical protein